MIREINASEFSNSVNTPELTVIKFGADWCQACNAMKPIVEEMCVNVPDVNFLDMNADKNADFVTGLGVKALPTFVFYKNGKLLAMEKGLNPTTLRNKVDEFRQ